MNWLDAESEPPTLAVRNETEEPRSVTVGCRTESDVVFTETVSLAPDGAERWAELPNEQFRIGIKVADGTTNEYDVDPTTQVTELTVSVTDSGLELASSTPTAPTGTGGGEPSAGGSESEKSNGAGGRAQQADSETADESDRRTQRSDAGRSNGADSPTRESQSANPNGADSPSRSGQSGSSTGANPQARQSDAGDASGGLAADEIYCRSCGRPIKQHAEICPECGVRNAAYEPAGGGGATGGSATGGGAPAQQSRQQGSQAGAQRSGQQQSGTPTQQPTESEPSGSWVTGVKISIGLYFVALLILLATIGSVGGSAPGVGRMLYTLGLATLLPVVQLTAWALFPLSMYFDLKYVDYHTDEWPLHSRLYLAGAIVLPIFLQILGGIGLFVSGGRLIAAIIPVVLMLMGIRYLRARKRHV